MFPQPRDNLAKMMQELGITMDDVLEEARRRGLSGLPKSQSDVENDVKQAKARFEAEKNMPPTPFTPQPRKSVLTSLEASRKQALEQERGARISKKYTIIGIGAHVSRTPLEHLDRILLHQMYVRKTHKGKYLLCRIVSVPVRVFSVHIAVEDSNGDACLLELYNYPGTVGASSKLIETLFPVGSVLAIREPTMTTAPDGNPILRTDCSSNVVWLEPDDERLVGVKWETGDRMPNAPRLPSTEEEWKNQGNDYYQKGWYLPAAVSFSRGLQRYPSSPELRLNRAMTYLQLEYYGAALSDCETALLDEGLSQSLKFKAVYRVAQAHYGMGHWDEAERGFRDTASGYPNGASSCKSWIQRCRDRRTEATEGKYNWAAAYRAAQVKGCKMDLAEFTGPVKPASLPSRGGGRGIVATRKIEFGELLMVSKAFAICSEVDFAYPDTYTAINLIANGVESSNSAGAATKIAERIAGDPHAARAISQLYSGPTTELPPSEYSITLPEKANITRLLNFEEDVDIERIPGALNFNAFEATSLGPGVDGPEAPLKATGLFLLPSLLNHSCSPNSRWYRMGDVMIIRATCDIPAGDEVFVSYGGEGDTYMARAKDSPLPKLLGTCNCSLCTRDRHVGDAVCRQREHIADQIISCRSLPDVRSHIKKLDETFKGYPTADRFAVLEANVSLANLYRLNFNLDDLVRTLFKYFEYAGFEVTDTSLRGPLPPGGRQAVPIKSVTTGGSRIGPFLPQVVDSCINIHNTFGGEFRDVERAAKWLKGAIWLHDKCYGGGNDLFWKRYPHLSDRKRLL